MKVQIKIQWTALFLIGTGIEPSDIAAARRLIDEVLQTELHADLKIIICINTTPSNLVELDPAYPNADVLRPDMLITAFFSIRNDRETGRNTLSFLRDDLSFDLQDKADVERFLTAEIQASHRYILFTWDHGAVYAMYHRASDAQNADEAVVFTDSQKMDKMLSDIKLNTLMARLTAEAEHSVQSISALTAAYTDPTPNVLTIKELARAISAALKGRKIDVLVMTNCYMQIFDTGYELCDAVDYLVAPETIIYMEGYNYRKILEAISRHPEISARKVARRAVKTYRTKPANRQLDGGRALTDVVISSVALAHWRPLARLLDQLADLLTAHLKTDFKAIQQARNEISYLENGRRFYIVDPYFFIDYLAKHWTNKRFRQYARLFNARHRNAVASLYTGRNFRPGGAYAHFRPKGFTVYFPQYENDIDQPLSAFLNEKDSENGASYVIEHTWENFVFQFAKLAGQRDFPHTE